MRIWINILLAYDFFYIFWLSKDVNVVKDVISHERFDNISYYKKYSKNT